MNRTDLRAGLDTSVLMRLLTGQPEPHAKVAVDYMTQIENEGAAVFVSSLVVIEAYFACQHHYHLPKKEVLKALFDLLSRPTFTVPPQVLNLLGTDGMATAKPGFVDRLIHAE